MKIGKMSVRVAIPEVAALRGFVEEKAGFKMHTHNQFLKLVIAIEDALGEHMSESTLERIWSYSTRQHVAVSLRSLDVLACYAGYGDWEKFCQYLKEEAGVESEMFNKDILNTDRLEVGDRLRIGWLPNRLCVIRYLGHYRFVAEETENSSMRPGDTFSCLQFQKNRELYLDCFLRAGEEYGGEDVRYAVGQEHGLTLLEKLENRSSEGE